MLIRVRDLRKAYRMSATEVEALRGVDLDVPRGEFVAMMGPSGSGKSTLMHLLGCLDRPTAGQYWLDGAAVGSLGDRELSRIRNRQIGFVFQAFNLIPQHTVLENVELPLVYAGVARDLRRERCLKLLHDVGLAHRVQHRPVELSGGETQRVAIARALAAEAPLLLADEPTGNLDTQTGQGIMELFTHLSRGGTTIVFVTHNPDIAAYADRVITMRDGTIVTDTRNAAAAGALAR
jgi:putative ABC transport system ATP-binding protein